MLPPLSPVALMLNSSSGVAGLLVSCIITPHCGFSRFSDALESDLCPMLAPNAGDEACQELKSSRKG